MRIHFDIWEKQREAAEVLPNGLKVLREDDASQRPCVTIFAPKATKPSHNYWFRTVESREEFITKTVEAFDAHLKRKRDHRIESTTGDFTLADPGAIFCNSWGYDQTNVDYYQVVKRTNATVWLRPIGQEMVEGSEQSLSEHVRPVKDAFLSEPCIHCNESKDYVDHDESCARFKHAYEPKPDGNTIKKRLQFAGGEPHISFSCGSGSLVKIIGRNEDGTAIYASHYQSHYH